MNNTIVEKFAEEMSKVRFQYLEKLAAAFFSKTNIPPEDVVLCEQATSNANGPLIKWWFQRKDD